MVESWGSRGGRGPAVVAAQGDADAAAAEVVQPRRDLRHARAREHRPLELSELAHLSELALLQVLLAYRRLGVGSDNRQCNVQHVIRGIVSR